MAIRKVKTKQSSKSARTSISSKDQSINMKKPATNIDKSNVKKVGKDATNKKMAKKKVKSKNSNNIKKKAKRKIRVNKTFGQKLKTFFLWIIFTLFVLGIIGGVVTGLFIKQAIEKAPEYTINEMFSLKDKSIIYDINGKEIARIGGNNRESITFEDMPQVYIDAMISIEDSKFFVHNGVDYNRFGKAILDVFTTGSFDGSGASTLTMQAAKNAITNTGGKQESTIEKIERKLQDIYLSVFVIEKNFTKEEIFEYYVNSSYLGGGAWGIQAAAETYFNKDVADLNLAEASFIAGLFQAPGYYDPYASGPEPAEKRRNIVLDLMVRHGYISQEVCDATKAIPLESYLTGYSDFSDKYVDYINAVVEEVIDVTGKDPYDVPMKIYTYMDTDLQDYLISIKNGEIEGLEFPDEELNLGLVMLDTETAQIRGVINGRYTVTKGISYATGERGRTHPGSTAKPIFDYAPCFEQEICYSTAQYILDDSYGYKNGTQIYNWDRTYKDFITLEDALAASRNIPALKLFHQLDNTMVADFVESLGITPQFEEKNGRYLFESHAIGSFEPGANALELAAAYAAFANDGIYTNPSAVDYIVLIDDNSKEEFTQTSTRVMSSETAFMINHMLVQSVESDVALIKNLRENGVNNAAKTGTSNWDVKYADELGTDVTSKDLYLINYNPHYSIGYWMGYGKLTQEHVDNGWLLTRDRKNFRMDIIEEIYSSDFIPRDNKDFEFSTKNIVEVEYEIGSDPLRLPSGNTPTSFRATGYFIKGTEPKEVSDRFLITSAPGGISTSFDASTGAVTLSWSHAALPNSSNYTNLYSKFNRDFAPNSLRHMMKYVEDNYRLFGDIGYYITLKKENGQDVKFLDFVHGGTTSYTVSADEYASLISNGKAKMKFGVSYRYEKGVFEDRDFYIDGGYWETGVVTATVQQHKIPTSEDNHNDGLKYQYIEAGSEFYLPTVNMYSPKDYPGQSDAETVDDFVSFITDSGLILGPDQAKYVTGENVTITFDDVSITKVTLDTVDILTDHEFEPVPGTTYVIEVTRQIPNPVDDDDDESTPPDPLTIEEAYTINLVFLAQDPILSYKPSMSKVSYDSITVKIYYVSNGYLEQVPYVDTNKVGNYDVYYSYKNKHGYVTTSMRHFKVHYSSQRLLDEQLKTEDKARKDNLDN